MSFPMWSFPMWVLPVSALMAMEGPPIHHQELLKAGLLLRWHPGMFGPLVCDFPNPPYSSGKSGCQGGSVSPRTHPRKLVWSDDYVARVLDSAT